MKSNKLWTQISGEKKNPLLIFFHGFMGSHRDFSPLIEVLGQSYCCLLMDLPGHGNSKNIIPHSIDEFDHLILNALSPYSREIYTTIGYSMGGRVSIKLSDKIQPQSMILISTRVSNLKKDALHSRTVSDEKKARELKEDYTSFLTSWYDQKLFKTLKCKPKLLEEVLRKRATENPSALAQIFKLVSPSRYSLPKNFLEQYKKPLLYLCGMEDAFYFSQKNLIQAQSKNAWTFSQSESSHSLHLEEPESVSQVINQFYRYYHDRMD